MVCHPISIQPVRGQGSPSALLRARGRAGCSLHPQDECMQLGLACRWQKWAAEVGVCGYGEGSLQVGERLPGAQAPGRHPSNVAAGQEGNGHRRKRSIW